MSVLVGLCSKFFCLCVGSKTFVQLTYHRRDTFVAYMKLEPYGSIQVLHQCIGGGGSLTEIADALRGAPLKALGGLRSKLMM